jgi:hypothetical protein
MNNHEALDVVLSEIYIYYHEQLRKPHTPDIEVLVRSTHLCTLIRNKYPECDYERFEVHLTKLTDKLRDKGYITRQGNPPNVFYSPTADGLLFIENGGYKAQQKIESNKAQIKNIERILLTAGTTLGGVYGLVEVLRFFGKNHHLKLTIKYLTIFLVFLFGILTGIAILLLAKEVLQQKSK